MFNRFGELIQIVHVQKKNEIHSMDILCNIILVSKLCIQNKANAIANVWNVN